MSFLTKKDQGIRLEFKVISDLTRARQAMSVWQELGHIPSFPKFVRFATSK